MFSNFLLDALLDDNEQFFQLDVKVYENAQ
jgi:hypothetical protein